MTTHLISVLAASTLLACAAAWAAGPAAPPGSKDELQRGRYLVQVAGCNDCHTPNYGPKNGQVDEKLWLTGDALGWSGPWGTTYPTNLRLLLANMTAQQWLHHARHMEPRPPMPWFNVRDMTTGDLRAMYRYVRSLGPAGKPAPAYLPPDKTPPQPYVAFPK